MCSQPQTRFPLFAHFQHRVGPHAAFYVTWAGELARAGNIAAAVEAWGAQPRAELANLRNSWLAPVPEEATDEESEQELVPGDPVPAQPAERSPATPESPAEALKVQQARIAVVLGKSKVGNKDLFEQQLLLEATRERLRAQELEMMSREREWLERERERLRKQEEQAKEERELYQREQEARRLKEHQRILEQEAEERLEKQQEYERKKIEKKLSKEKEAATDKAELLRVQRSKVAAFQALKTRQEEAQRALLKTIVEERAASEAVFGPQDSPSPPVPPTLTPSPNPKPTPTPKKPKPKPERSPQARPKLKAKSVLEPKEPRLPLKPKKPNAERPPEPKLKPKAIMQEQIVPKSNPRPEARPKPPPSKELMPPPPLPLRDENQVLHPNVQRQVADSTVKDKVTLKRPSKAEGSPSKKVKETPVAIDPFTPEEKSRVAALAREKLRPDVIPIVIRPNSKCPPVDVPGMRFETRLWGEPKVLTVLKPLGTGSYGTVYLAALENSKETKALKRLNESSAWEVYIRQQITLRIKPFTSASPIPPILPFEGAFLFQDSTLIAMNYYQDARLTAFQILNVHRLQGSPLPEPLVVWWSLSLMEIIQKFHEAGFIHADLKPDNVLLHLKYQGGETPDIGVTLIDFGRTIDCSLYASEMQFAGTNILKKYRCTAMREGRSWKYDLDLFGIAAIAHAMLHGKPLAVEKQGLTWAPATKLRRYWNQELWTPFFHKLINPQDPARELTQLCTTFREALARPSQLKDLLRKELDLVAKQEQ